MRKEKIHLALGSGGARGLAHIGIIEGLEKRKNKITAITGSSIGALVGGAYACGRLDAVKEWALGLSEDSLFSLFDFTYAKNGLIKGEKIMAKLKELGLDVAIEELPIPFAAVAVDLKTKREVVFRKGSLLTAIRASIAIPTLFTPLFWEGMELIDGGVTNPVPIGLLQQSAREKKVVVSLNGNFPYLPPAQQARQIVQAQSAYRRIVAHFMKEWVHLLPTKKPLHKKDGVVGLLDQCFDIMQDQITHMTIDKYQPDLIVEISRKACSTFEFHRAAELIEAGRQAFDAALAERPEEVLGGTFWQRLFKKRPA